MNVNIIPSILLNRSAVFHACLSNKRPLRRPCDDAPKCGIVGSDADYSISVFVVFSVPHAGIFLQDVGKCTESERQWGEVEDEVHGGRAYHKRECGRSG